MNIFVFLIVFGNDGRPREYRSGPAVASLLATRGGNGNTTAGGNGNTARAQQQDLNPLSLERKNPLMLRMFGEKCNTLGSRASKIG